MGRKLTAIVDQLGPQGPYRKAWILRLQNSLGRKLAVIVDRLGPLQRSSDSEASESLGRQLMVIVDQLGPLQKSLDSEASELPGQKVNGNSGPARAPTEKLRSCGLGVPWAES